MTDFSDFSESSIAIIVSRFNQDVTERLLQGAQEYLREVNIPDTQVSVVHVPGAFEIPVMAQHLARSQRFQAIICLGAVIRGETDHYEYVCRAVSSGCQQVALQYHIPVIFGILTTYDESQALERAGGVCGNKGREAAACALAMIETMNHSGLGRLLNKDPADSICS